LFRSDTPEFKRYEEVTRRFPSSEFDVLVVIEGKNRTRAAGLQPWLGWGGAAETVAALWRSPGAQYSSSDQSLYGSQVDPAARERVPSACAW